MGTYRLYSENLVPELGQDDAGAIDWGSLLSTGAATVQSVVNAASQKQVLTQQKAVAAEQAKLTAQQTALVQAQTAAAKALASIKSAATTAAATVKANPLASAGVVIALGVGGYLLYKAFSKK
jgi:hypothetical protein